ncbi:bacteriohemerythrin [Azonexus sp.]|uniref:bacteriohemerythrin n=1 Tax=Azonexus sp. TaxID=1872668 RepID=UPI0035B1D857
MEAFVWDQRFETGLDLVDSQHRQLVETTNELGDTLIAGGVDEAKLQALFHRLAEYARHHFADEEKLMQAQGIDPRHLREHTTHHHQFIEQVVAMWRSRATMQHPAETLHGFLAAWLTVHILGEDQVMARQLAHIRSGATATEAYAREREQRDPTASILLEALGRLYALVSEQNRNLAASNASLEERVSARTHELAEANHKLETEHQELTALLRKVEEAQQQLLQSEKMAAIGQLAAGVAHEINNPIGFVNSNLSSLKNYVSQLLAVIAAYEGGDGAAVATARRAADLDFLREDLPALLAESQEGLNRVTRIVQDLKDFSRVDQTEHQSADLNAALQSTLNVVRNELKYKAEVVLELGDIPAVDCVPAQINQVFMNLLVNAAQAIPEHGRITVRSGIENAGVWFEIEDTGRGMSDAVRQRIFEPFFTTKPVGKGTGLGLSISYDIIVKKHRGHIDVQSEPGKGSRFRIWLPIQAAGEAA